MIYSVKEIYFTLQGEGVNAGRPAVFCRFAGCNLWTGREEDRATAVCWFCDTDFVGTDGPGGGKFAGPAALAAAISDQWPETSNRARPLVVFTGGEPLLQLDARAVEALHGQGFEVAVETNGTKLPPKGVDWVCVSPKQAVSELILRWGNELKLVYPQAALEPEAFVDLEFEHFFLQPMEPVGDSKDDWDENIEKAIRYCLENPQWRLSMQTHKYAGIR